MSDDTLRALIRLIPPVRTLKEDLEQSLVMELYAGTGDLAVKSFNGLQAGVAAITNDPYVASLNLSVPAEATDKEKVSLAKLAGGQLAAYLEGQTGLVSLGGGGGHSSIQTAPTISINNIHGLPAESVDKMVALGTSAMEEHGSKEEK